MTERPRPEEVGKAAALVGEDLLRHIAVRIAAFAGVLALGLSLLNDGGSTTWRGVGAVWGGAGLLLLLLTTLGGWSRRSQWVVCVLLIGAAAFTLLGLR